MAKKRKNITEKAVQESETPYIPTVDTKPEPDEEPWGRTGLTVRQRLFVKAYIGPAAGNGMKAAEMAGYRAENRNSLAATASAMLNKPNVARALSRALARRSGGKKWTLRGLVEIAKTSMADFVTVDDQGQTKVDFAKARDGAAIGAIKKLKCTPEGDIVAIELYDRKSALDSLAKIHGTLIERHEHTGKDGKPLEVKHSVDYDAIEAELGAIGLARRVPSNN